MSGVRGYDNLYNERVNDIALMNYNKGIANRLRMQEQAMQARLPFKEPQQLSGGVRASNSIVAGTTAEGPSTLAVGGRAFRTFTGNEKPSQGGKISRIKKANKWLDFSKKAVGDAFDVASMAGMGSGGKVSRIKKANKWLDYSKGVVGDAFDIYDQAKARGGKVSRIKKANKWLDYSKGVVGDAFDIYDQAKARGGMVYSSELKKALGGCGDCSGGAKKPRKPRTARFAKGSAEAKAWGEKMKQARMNKM